MRTDRPPSDLTVFAMTVLRQFRGHSWTILNTTAVAGTLIAAGFCAQPDGGMHPFLIKGKEAA